jgi:hypothetical protein
VPRCAVLCRVRSIRSAVYVAGIRARCQSSAIAARRARANDNFSLAVFLSFSAYAVQGNASGASQGTWQWVT